MCGTSEYGGGGYDGGDSRSTDSPEVGVQKETFGGGGGGGELDRAHSLAHVTQ